ncbi:class I SAM-dependent methyltransferase [Ktedonospora formicarum]|uniref:Putative methyltransferase YcgJ n=1 Tax=Ktedonospora formicarum TaxID=2778364 RepID=A0A8J3HU40_9CHLR|nr:methyltransferase domain-containing protein [Ktedonospora formicarum]GHO43311.1 putative methyltransferase YcgJ [Ktedonospora formicarum]
MSQEETQASSGQQASASERNQLIQNNFGVAAHEYVTSTVHAQGPDLAWLVEAARLQGDETVVDVATGTGHTALALAPHTREVIAIDFTVSMLEGGKQLAHERGIDNVRFVEGDAHALPLADGSVDVVACRFSAHHFVDIACVVSEWARVLKPGGRLVLIDTISPDNEAQTALLHEIEVLRDPSHVRNHSTSEWLTLLEEAGIDGQTVRIWGLRLDVPTWTQRMRTPAASVERIERLLTTTTPEVRAALRVAEEEGVFSFDLPTALIVGVKN